MKNKLFFLVVSIMISTTALAQFSGSGSGTKDDPYLIYNPVQLDQVRNFLGNSNVYFAMMADIDLEEFISENYPTQGWLPIGTSTNPYQGHFDGNGKKISNLIINRLSSENVGFFGCIAKYSSVQNLTIEVDIIGGNNTGGIAGQILADETGASKSIIFSGITLKGTIIGQDNVGGLIGKCCQNNLNGNRKISDCFVDVSVKGAKYVGGFVGYGIDMEISSSSAIVDLFATGEFCGGIAGFASFFNYSPSSMDKYFNISNISTCNVSGNVVGNWYIGGIIGYLEGTRSSNKHSTIQDSYFVGKVAGGSKVGGVCGHSSCGDIIKNYTSATISGNEYIGGIVGEANYGHQIFQNVAINNKISGNDFVGRIYGDKDSDTSIGEIGTSNTNKALNSTIVLIDGVEQVCEDNEQHGQGVGKSLLKYKATYQGIGWDFTDTWDMQETENYPYFKWQAAPPIINQATSSNTIVSGSGADEAIIHLIINGQNYQATCNDNVWSTTTLPLIAGDTIYAYATLTDKTVSYIVTSIVVQAPITRLNLTDETPTFATGVYEGGIEYTRTLVSTDEYASFCLPFSVKQNENAASIAELYIPLGIALKYTDANNEEVLKILFVATEMVEAGKPFIAKLADTNSSNVSVVASKNEITQGVEELSIDIIPYIYDATAVGSQAAIPISGNVSWSGTFEEIGNQACYVLLADGDFMYQSGITINPFRGFLNVSNMPTIKKIVAFIDSEDQTTSIEEFLGTASSLSRKILRDGQILILRGEKVYTITGQEIIVP